MARDVVAWAGRVISWKPFLSRGSIVQTRNNKDIPFSPMEKVALLDRALMQVRGPSNVALDHLENIDLLAGCAGGKPD